MSEKVVAPYGKLSDGQNALWKGKRANKASFGFSFPTVRK